MKTQKNNKGFTLVEILIAVSILAIVVVPLLANFVSSSKVNSESKKVLNGTAVAQNIMEGISAYGVHNAIVQLENYQATPVKLDFLPSSMTVENWGRAVIKKQEVHHSDGTTSWMPDYKTDVYQDGREQVTTADGTKKSGDYLIVADSYEDGIFDDTTHAVNSSYVFKYLSESERDNKVYFKVDQELHAYMFWLKNVTYGKKTYDILLSMDGNKYRGEVADSLDTTQDVRSYSRDDMTAKINTTSDDFSKGRNYNTVALTEIPWNIGTNVAVNDDVQDRFFMEDSNAFADVVDTFWRRCVNGVTKEEIEQYLHRRIYVKIRKEANTVDPTKPYTIVGIQYTYSLSNTALLKNGESATYSTPEEIVFKSCKQQPRNLFLFYTPNYEPTYNSIPLSDSAESIYILNAAGKEEGGVTYGTDMNLFIIRQCKESSINSSDLSTREDRYKVSVELVESLKDGSVDNLRTHLYTNIDYDINANSDMNTKLMVSGKMGTYRVNGALTNRKTLRVRNLSGFIIEPLPGEQNEQDYLYDVTIQVFESGKNFDSKARIAKFTGSSN